MAHLIDETIGRAAIAYSGQTPWHGLGSRLSQQDRRDLRAALAAAGIDYDVKRIPIGYKNLEGVRTQVPDAFGIIRTDTGAYLATVGHKYQPIQNREAFGIVETLVKEHGMTVEVAGALDGGKRAFLLLRMPDTSITPVEGDDVRGYCLVITSHDGSTATKVILTLIRVVCQNTLNMAMSGKHSTVVSVRHTASAKARIEEAKHITTQFSLAMQEAGETFASLAQKTMGPREIAAFIETIIPAPKTGLTDTLKARRESIGHLVFYGAGQAGAQAAMKGEASAWHVYNGVTEYFDHRRVAETKSEAGRIEAQSSALFGANALLKAKALRQLVAA